MIKQFEILETNQKFHLLKLIVKDENEIYPRYILGFYLEGLDRHSKNNYGVGIDFPYTIIKVKNDLFPMPSLDECFQMYKELLS